MLRRPGHDRDAVLAAVLAGLAAWLHAADVGASPRSQPPPSVRDAATSLGCAPLGWTTWPGGWWADCTRTETSARDGTVTVHRYLAFHRQADGQFSMETIAETRATDSLRVKSPRSEQVVLHNGRATYEARSASGYVHRRVWDLSTNPARLLEEREGGGKVCQEGFASHRSDLVHPLCVTDYTHHRQRCTVQAPSCDRDPVRIATTSYTAIPVHIAGAKLREPDLFQCAVEIGASPDDLVSGSNTGRTVFRIVAVDDATEGTLALHARVIDATPQPPSDDGWLAHDHWKLWLASQHADLACDDTADLAGYCQRSQTALDAVAFVIAPHGGGADVVRVTTAAGTPPASWASDITARDDGAELIIQLTGVLRDWARGGAITLAYSDSRHGVRPDVVLASSRVQPGRSETLGQLGDTLLCDRPTHP